MHYERIIKRAFQVTWRHKVLWVFGIAAALFGGGMRGHGGGGQGMQYTLGSGNIAQIESIVPWLSGGDWQRLASLSLALLVLMAIVGLVLLIVSIIVRYTSLGALIGMVDEIEEKGETSFKSGLQVGWDRLLRLFAINLIIGLATGVIVIVLLLLLGVVAAAGAIPAALMISAGRALRTVGIIVAIVAGLILLLLMFLVFAALSALVTLAHEFSFRACVLERLGVFAALSAGIELVRSRLREGVLFWLLLLGIDIAVSLATVPLVLVGLGGGVLSGLAIFGLTESVGAALLAGLPVLVVIVLASIFVGGLYFTFRSAAWTLAFRDLRSTAEPAEAS